MTSQNNSLEAVKKNNLRVFLGEAVIGGALALFLASYALAGDAILPPGQKVFEGKCAQCHGKDAKGLAKMAKVLKVDQDKIDLTRAEVVKMTDSEVAKTVTDGNKKMPKFKGKLTDEQIQETIKYLRSLQNGKAGTK